MGVAPEMASLLGTHSISNAASISAAPAQISGYDKFVGEVELAHSEHILAELLEFLIDHNRLELPLSDLDGEALVFYRVGDPPSAQAVLEQADAWASGFHTRLKRTLQSI